MLIQVAPKAFRDGVAEIDRDCRSPEEPGKFRVIVAEMGMRNCG